MKEIVIQANDAGQRLDRFLKKYLARAPLSAVYKAIRKDVRVDGKRRAEDYQLSEGQTLAIYLSDGQIEEWSLKKRIHSSKRQFRIVFEEYSCKPGNRLPHRERGLRSPR